MKGRRLFVILATGAMVLVGAMWAGPVSSGAVLLLMPTGLLPYVHDLPDDYTPGHRGGIDLGTGLYVRRDEDLVVRGTPPLILRRTYVSQDRASKAFGIGASHNGELHVEGDADRFQWLEVVLANNTRIRFERLSWGSSVYNALYEHRSSPSEWRGARAGWVGNGWALRRKDGTLMRFQPCGPGVAARCALVEERDADGHVVKYRRDARGRLLRIEAAPDRWIAFDYDDRDRISRAYDSAQHHVKYDYDERGRLAFVRSSENEQRRYEYTDRDEMAIIVDPDIRIENAYHDGRCIRQVNRWPDQDEPYTVKFAYTLSDRAIVETNETRSDGSWVRYRYSRAGYVSSEAWGTNDGASASVDYSRDTISNIVTKAHFTCRHPSGKTFAMSSEQRDDDVRRAFFNVNCAVTPEDD